VAVAGAAALPAVAGAGSGGDGSEIDPPTTRSDLDLVTTVALGHLGEARVTETEVGDEGSYYEVEVTLDNGHQVGLELDEQFNVVGRKKTGQAQTSHTCKQTVAGVGLMRSAPIAAQT